MAFKCVPLNTEWTKLDIRAIYRRPSGDLTSAMPLRRHMQWQAKGFEYVTLADRESLAQVAHQLSREGKDPRDFINGLDEHGDPSPWNQAAYLSNEVARQAREDDETRALIEKYGLEQVEAIRGKAVPEHLKPKPEPVMAAVGAEAIKGRK